MMICSSIGVSISSFSCFIVVKGVICTSSSFTSTFTLITEGIVACLLLLLLVLAELLLLLVAADVDGCGDAVLSLKVSVSLPLVFSGERTETL